MSALPEALVVTGEGQADWAVIHLSDFHAALVRAGVPATHVHLKDGDLDTLREMISERLAGRRPFFVFSQNGGVPAGPAPKFNFMGDHPLDHYDTVADTGQNAVYSFVDRRQTDLSCLRLENPPPAIFCPTGGPPLLADAPAIAGRDTDILFSGSIFFDPERGAWGERFGTNDLLRNIFTIAVDDCIENYEDAYIAIRRACETLSVDPADMEFALLRSLFGLVEGCCQAYVRKEIISRLRDVSVKVMGSFPNDTFHDTVDVELIGHRSFREAMELMARSKVVLNIVPKFSDGAHERVFYGMSRGAAVLTTESAYLAETFENGRSILFIKRGNRFDAAAVAEIVHDDAALQGIVDAASPLFQAHHTWDARVAPVLGAIGPLFNGFRPENALAT